MQHIIQLDQPIKIYYNDKVYSPKYSSINTINLVDKLISDIGKPLSVLDVGCGSGVIGLSVKSIHPNCQVTLCDIDKSAVQVSRLNSKRLGLRVKVKKCDMVPNGEWNIIVANLPTFSDEDMEQELHGPDVSYYAGEPMSMYRKLFKKKASQFLVCECQPIYQQEFLALAAEEGYTLILSAGDAFAFIGS